MTVLLYGQLQLSAHQYVFGWSSDVVLCCRREVRETCFWHSLVSSVLHTELARGLVGQHLPAVWYWKKLGEFRRGKAREGPIRSWRLLSNYFQSNYFHRRKRPPRLGSTRSSWCTVVTLGYQCASLKVLSVIFFFHFGKNHHQNGSKSKKILSNWTHPVQGSPRRPVDHYSHWQRMG